MVSKKNLEKAKILKNLIVLQKDTLHTICNGSNDYHYWAQTQFGYFCHQK